LTSEDNAFHSPRLAGLGRQGAVKNTKFLIPFIKKPIINLKIIILIKNWVAELNFAT